LQLRNFENDFWRLEQAGMLECWNDYFRLEKPLHKLLAAEYISHPQQSAAMIFRRKLKL